MLGQEWQLTDEEIGAAAYKNNPTYKGGVLEYTRRPDADRAIARAAQKKLMEWLIKRGDPYIDNGLVRFELLSKAWRVLLKELGVGHD